MDNDNTEQTSNIIRTASEDEIETFQNNFNSIHDRVHELVREAAETEDLPYFILVVPGRTSAAIMSDIPPHVVTPLLAALAGGKVHSVNEGEA